MNTDKLKTLILFVLVVSALILTFFLWYGDYPYYEDTEPVFQEDFFIEEPRCESNILAPLKILLPLKDDFFTVFRRGEKSFQLIWDTFLGEMSNGEIEEMPAISLPEEEPEAVIFFEPEIFPEMIYASEDRERDSFSILKLFIEDNDEVSIFFDSPENNGLLIKLNGQSTGAALANIITEVLNKGYTDYYLLKDSESVDDDLEDAEDDEARETDIDNDDNEIQEEDAGISVDEAGELFNYSVEKDIYLSQEGLLVSSFIDFKEETFSREDLLRAIFIDKDLARRIAEPDGTLIFTDGERGLRISGNVEYTAPGLEEGAVNFSYRSALNKANEYICFYGGWPDKLFLREIYKSGSALIGDESFRGYWNYYIEGFPVLGERGATEVRFNDQGLFYYKRSLLVPDYNSETEKVTTAPGEEALTKALDIYRNEYDHEEDDIFNINDLFMAYITDINDSSEEILAYPTWVVQVEGENIFLDAINLKQVFPGDNDEYF